MRDLLAKLRAFEQAHPSRPGPLCAVCRLPEPLRAFLSKGREGGSTYRALAGLLTQEGHKVSAYQVSYHLREHAK